MVEESNTLESVLVARLLEVRGNSYKKSDECGAAKQIIRKFVDWTVSNYPLLDAEHITRELVMEYLFQVAHDARSSGQVREYGFAELTAEVLADATGLVLALRAQ